MPGTQARERMGIVGAGERRMGGKVGEYSWDRVDRRRRELINRVAGVEISLTNGEGESLEQGVIGGGRDDDNSLIGYEEG